ncbi:MAG TPA: hypothetical protein VGM25_13440 [Caulobacteraceae bacterium]
MVQDIQQTPAELDKVRPGEVITEAINLLDLGFSEAWWVWLGLAAIMISTDLVILVFGATGAYALTSAQTIALAVRTLGLLWVFVAGLRATVLSRGLWQPDGGFWIGLGRMAAIQAAILIPAGVILRVFAGVIEGALGDAHAAHTWVLWFAVALAVAIIPLEIKTSPWPISALAGECKLNLEDAWRRSRGTTWSAIIAWVVLVLPFMLVHFALSAWIEQSTAAQGVRIALTVVDCLVSVIETWLMIGVMAALYVLSRQRADGTPAAA